MNEEQAEYATLGERTVDAGKIRFSGPWRKVDSTNYLGSTAYSDEAGREAALAEVTASWMETYATNPTRFDECAEELPTLHESIVINGVQRMCWTVVC